MILDPSLVMTPRKMSRGCLLYTPAMVEGICPSQSKGMEEVGIHREYREVDVYYGIIPKKTSIVKKI